jgi:uncharacterized protein YdaU (DUF1376 family)
MRPNDAPRRNRLPYMKFFLYDWREETLHWPFMAAAIHIELILCQWDQPLPGTERALAQRVGLALAEFRPWWRGYVKATFVLVDGHWQHPRTAELRAEVEAKCRKTTKAANERWEKQRTKGVRTMAEVIEANASRVGRA